MIELQNVDKKFRDIHAADQISAKIQDGMIFGLVGSNGAGKSTLLRMISGIIKPDSGEILADGEPVFENPAVKRQICFLSDTAILLCKCMHRGNARLLYDSVSIV